MQIGTYIILMVQTHEKYLLFYFINIIKTKNLKSSNNSIYETSHSIAVTALLIYFEVEKHFNQNSQDFKEAINVKRFVFILCWIKTCANEIVDRLTWCNSMPGPL